MPEDRSRLPVPQIDPERMTVKPGLVMLDASVPEGSEVLAESWMALAPLNQAAVVLDDRPGIAMALPPVKGVP